MDLFYGIDVASESLQVWNEGSGHQTIKNDKRAIARFLKALPEGAVLALEPTGSYGRALADAAVAMGLEVYMLRPASIKKFREAGPARGKTDRIDAQVIHAYVAAYRGKLKPYTPFPPFEEKLRRLSRSRTAIADKVASMRNQLKSLGDDSKTVERILGALVRRLAELTSQIESMVSEAEDAAVLSSIPGIKARTIAAVFPALRAIPFQGKYALDSYAGMDLKPNESGKSKGRRHISKQGDRRMRRAMYMAALGACRSKAWRDYYTRLKAVKKLKPIQALNALARKLLHVIYGVFKSQTAFKMPATT